MKKKHIISLFIFLTLCSLNVGAQNIEKATDYYNDAIDLYKQDDLEGSAEMFKRAIDIKPDFYEALYNLSQILMSMDKNEEAYEYLKELIKINPKDYETLYNIGKIQYKRGYLSSSHKYLSQISLTAPQYESAKILINKIEKRQSELNLETLIKENKKTTDAKGKSAFVGLVEIKAPSGTAVDADGNIYVASFAENAIYKISIYGKQSLLTNSSLIRGPIGITVDNESNIYVANYNANNILKVAPTGIVSIFATVEKPYCITYDKEHNRLYATEQNTNKLIKIDL